MGTDNSEDLKNLLGLGSASIRKSYYPELQDKIDELNGERNYIVDIINSLSSSIIGIDGRGVVTRWNRSAEKEFSLSGEAAVGRKLAELLPYLNDILAIQPVRGRFRKSRNVNGKIVFEDVSIYPLSSDDRTGAVIRIDDITEQVRMNEAMVQSEKMLSIGGMAAGMAHEINNPLAGIIQTSGVLSKRLLEKDLDANIAAAEKAGITMEQLGIYAEERGLGKMLAAIGESGKRATEIIRNMLRFSRKETSFSLHDPVELLEQILQLAATDFNLKKHYDFKNIRINREFEEKLPEVTCSESQIQQVFLNLLRNGAEAMWETGKEGYEPAFTLRCRSEGNMVRFEIEDNGPGMSPRVCEKIFEPFFTTKARGIGTGLGLSVSYYIIVDNHRGTMEVKSPPGKGACFVIRLPLER